VADQTVKIESDSGSPPRVAYDLMKYVTTYSSDKSTTLTKDEILDLYSECYRVAWGQRRTG